MILKKMTVNLKMNEIERTNLTDQTKFGLNEIRKIENLTKKLTKENHAVEN